MGLSDRLSRKNRLTGRGITDYVPPRLNQNGQLELHAPFANYMGPRTNIVRRVREHIKPTTASDAAAKKHDIQYHNIGVKLARGQINRQQAIAQVKASDNQLLRTAAINKLTGINPVNQLHATAALVGISGKKIAQGIGAMDELKFVGTQDGEILEGGRKKKGRQKDLVKDLKKRFKKVKIKE